MFVEFNLGGQFKSKITEFKKFCLALSGPACSGCPRASGRPGIKKITSKKVLRI